VETGSTGTRSGTESREGEATFVFEDSKVLETSCFKTLTGLVVLTTGTATLFNETLVVKSLETGDKETVFVPFLEFTLVILPTKVLDCLCPFLQ
jgi:hypothetical protein